MSTHGSRSTTTDLRLDMSNSLTITNLCGRSSDRPTTHSSLHVPCANMCNMIDIDPTPWDTHSLGIALPDGWTLHSEKAGQPPTILQRSFFPVLGFTVRVVCDISNPFSGPTEMHITLDTVWELEADGITADVLRAVPLGEVRRVMSEYAARILAATGQDLGPHSLPERIETPHDYARMAARYVQLVESMHRQPVNDLARALGLSRNTVSARIRRARQMGLLEGEPRKPATRLTDKARQLLSEIDHQDPSSQSAE